MGAMCESADRYQAHLVAVRDYLDRHPDMAAAVQAIEDMGGDERSDLFALYCRACGCIDPRCPCENDE